MGLNIIAYRVTGIGPLEAPFGGGGCLETERYPNFDTGRYTGDRDFAMEIDWIHHPAEPEDRHYRPEDFEAAKQWVRDNISPGNQERLLNLLDAMEKDPDLHVYFSW